MKSPSLALGVAACGLLAGCVVGPNYKRPPAPAPEAYKTVAPWREAAPKDSIPKGAWWEIYQDAELNAYEQQLLNANQSLIAAITNPTCSAKCIGLWKPPMPRCNRLPPTCTT